MYCHRFSWCHGISRTAILILGISTAPAKPLIIDDQKIAAGLFEVLKNASEEGGATTSDQLAEVAKKSGCLKPKVSLPKPPVPAHGASYEELSRSVYFIMSVYKCGKCEHWHQGASASAWCLGEDGMMVTNAHVFRNAKGGAMGVSDREGHCHLVTELLGIDVVSDIAVFRVKGSGLPALALGSAAEVGTPVTAITNPSGNLFYQSSGSVARYFQRPGEAKGPVATWMAVTADYAKGSSGGPIFNAAGEVVGMVSNTSSIYTGEGENRTTKNPVGSLQMVVKNCVPVEAIQNLFAPEAPAPSSN